MNKSKKPRLPANRLGARTTQPPASSNGWKSIISLWLIVHFFGLLLALSANLVPSAMQRRLLEGLAPYLTVIHQSYGLIPLEMIQGAELDHPFLFEIHRQGEPADSWQPVLPTAIKDARYAAHGWKQFTRLSAIVALEQQDSVVTGLCEAAVRSHARTDASGVDGVRIVRLAAPSFEQATLIATGQGDLIRSELSDEVLYQATIVKFADGRIAFVSESSPARAAKSVAPGSETQATGARGQP